VSAAGDLWQASEGDFKMAFVGAGIGYKAVSAGCPVSRTVAAWAGGREVQCEWDGVGR